jgi:hypothetical protein
MSTYDPTTDAGKVRLIIGDTDAPDNTIFSDEEINTFLALSEVDDETEVRIAAAYALETMASSQAMVQKKIKMLDLQTDGPAVAESLRKSAQRLRDEVENEVAFGYAETGYNDWTRYQIIINQALREY